MQVVVFSTEKRGGEGLFTNAETASTGSFRSASATCILMVASRGTSRHAASRDYRRSYDLALLLAAQITAAPSARCHLAPLESISFNDGVSCLFSCPYIFLSFVFFFLIERNKGPIKLSLKFERRSRPPPPPPDSTFFSPLFFPRRETRHD